MIVRALYTAAALAAAVIATPADADTGALVDALTKQVGVSEQQATGGAGAMFKLAEARLQPEEFSEVSEALPGIDGLMAAAPETSLENTGASTLEKNTLEQMGTAAGGSSGAKSALGGTAGPATGSVTSTLPGAAGDAGSLSSLAGPFGELGMSPDQVQQFVPVILDYAQSEGGSTVMGLLQKGLLGM